jgi:hypothetical protein
MAENEKPKLDRARNYGRLTEEQDSALDRAVEALSRRRGNRVTRADITREALADYLRGQGLEWPC